MDRVIEQAIVKLFEYFNDGYTYIVDIDLEKVFDNVPQDKLMTLVHNLINDPDTESLIWKYLNAGVMVKGKYEKITKGTPAGRKPFIPSQQHNAERHVRWCERGYMLASTRFVRN